MSAIGLSGFETKFEGNDDPWSTWNKPDEVLKRRAILHAVGAGVRGRMLELGAGNGSNSASLARRALRLDATEATRAGTRLVAQAVAFRGARARALRLRVPGRPPRGRYDAIVVAELLYYLDRRAMHRLARQVGMLLRPGGVLILAHHRVTFYDFAQHADGIHARFLGQTRAGWRVRDVRRTSRWIVLACTLR